MVESGKHGGIQGGGEPLLKRYAIGMRAELLDILARKSPSAHDAIAALPPSEQAEQLWQQPEIRSLLTDAVLYDLGFYVGAVVIRQADKVEFVLESVRVSHSSAGVPEFIQLFGHPADTEAGEEAPLYLGHIHQFLSAETLKTVISPEDLGLTSH